MIKVKATINKYIYRTDSFCILSIFTQDYRILTVKGEGLNNLNFEDTYQFTLYEEEVINPKYGQEYIVVSYCLDYDFESVDKQRAFFETIIPKKTLDNLYKTLGNPIETIKKKDLVALCTVKGVGEKAARALIEKYENAKGTEEIFNKLSEIGLNSKMIEKVKKQVFNKGLDLDSLLNKLVDNIYELVPVIGFKDTDYIALHCKGYRTYDRRRLVAIATNYLIAETNKGNSVIKLESIGFEFNKLGIFLSTEEFRELFKKEKSFVTISPDLVGLHSNFILEFSILKKLRHLRDCYNRFSFNDLDAEIKEVEENINIMFTEEQYEGIKTALSNNVVLITGLAGTGKTKLTEGIIKVLNKYNYKIKQCALSGRASQRMKEVNKTDSSTIHSLIQYGNRFQLNENHPLDTDVLIVDEASMIDGNLFQALVRAIDYGTKVIIIGDDGQLPSIGIANIFYDLLSLNEFPTVKLTKIQRQALESSIISESLKVRKNVPLVDSDFVGNFVEGTKEDFEVSIIDSQEDLVTPVISKYFNLLPREKYDTSKIQIIVPGNVPTKNSMLCAKHLNKCIQDRLFKVEKDKYIEKGKNEYLFVGDRVIAKRNQEFKGQKVCNGNIGKIVKIKEGQKIVVYFSDLDKEIEIEKDYYREHIDLAYAISCHALQGSSVPTVIVGLGNDNYHMQSSEWLYTALTRAESKCVLIAHNKAIQNCSQKSITSKKQTFLNHYMLNKLKKEPQKV